MQLIINGLEFIFYFQIIHSNEKESIQFNAQMLPPDIPDVRTIEKMHFMSLTPPNTLVTNSNQNQQQTTNVKNSNSIPSSCQSSIVSVHVLPETVSPVNVTPLNNKQSVFSNNNNNSFNSNNANYVNCDNSSDRTTVVNETVFVENHHLQQPPPRNQEEEIDEGPPPVVILSGLGNKEVQGLVFGFDINEQLLNEDICENFISRYVEPENFKNSTPNHEKIVNFIGSGEY